MRERLTKEQIVVLDLLLVPKGVVLPTEAGVVQTAATLRELVAILDASVARDEVPVVHIENRQMLEVINRYAELFPVAAAVLDDVPGGDYDVVFSNYTHMLPAITIGELIDSNVSESATVNAIAQADMNDKPHPRGTERQHERSRAITDRASGRSSAAAPVPTSIRGRAKPEDPITEEEDLGEVHD